MAFIEFTFRPVEVQPFLSAVVSSMMFAVGLATLGTIAWRIPALHLAAAVFLPLLLFATLLQLWRVRRAYAAAYSAAMSDENGLLARALNEMMRTYMWGSVMFLIATMAGMQVYVQLR